MGFNFAGERDLPPWLVTFWKEEDGFLVIDGHSSLLAALGLADRHEASAKRVHNSIQIPPALEGIPVALQGRIGIFSKDTLQAMRDAGARVAIA